MVEVSRTDTFPKTFMCDRNTDTKSKNVLTWDTFIVAVTRNVTFANTFNCFQVWFVYEHRYNRRQREREQPKSMCKLQRDRRIRLCCVARASVVSSLSCCSFCSLFRHGIQALLNTKIENCWWEEQIHVCKLFACWTHSHTMNYVMKETAVAHHEAITKHGFYLIFPFLLFTNWRLLEAKKKPPWRKKKEQSAFFVYSFDVINVEYDGW